MQLDSKLTLEAAKMLARQCEAVHEQQEILRTPHKQELVVEAIGRKRGKGRAPSAGLGNLGEVYHIKLKEGAVPYFLFTPRNVAIPL